ncbi:BON domain-containing protein [Ramlibacter montanisoli]|uniref:BON domain-containing protein n=1 Tax=Ramlibacter montanisoli TaxID=2732512 RepID=A0A849K066_9BURK|nr:BON domain-containing protein [Ramlibacter montanisoli]NNU41922.1 BON domain-containing protein [Ramlibacter montanisoli]
MKNSTMARAALTASSLAVLLALGACGERVENTETQTSQPNVEINRQGTDGAKEETAAIGVGNNDTTRMGAGAEAPANDQDQRIATDVQTSLATNPDFGAIKVDVHVEDGKVTLRGRAPDPAARDRAAEIARNVSGVKAVDNQLTLG